MAGKAARVVSTLSRRIAQGDYLGAALPSERALAEQEGVSYMTARKAVQDLIGAGLLARTPTGRLVVNREAPPEARPLQVACIAPSFPSSDMLNWQFAVDRVVAERSASSRAKAIPFAHWEDPTLRHALERCDGAFVYPLAERVPAPVLDLLRAHRVVILDQDYAGLGLPSIRLSPVEAIDDLLDHLASLGHRSIACLNVQPYDHAIEERIAQWRAWCTRRGVGGTLINRPVRSHEQPATAACDTLRGMVLTDTAIFATTMAGAMGANRALHDRGLQVGSQVALCTLNDEGLGTVTVPSITAAAPPDPDPWLRRSLDWMSDPAKPQWQGPMLMQPERRVIAVRESSRAFTLIELLVVVSIIAILAAMLLPAISTVRNAAKIVQCSSNLRQVGIAMMTYASDAEGYLPNQLNSSHYYPTAAMMDDYLPTSDRAWRCTAPDRVKATSSTFPFVINWRLEWNQVSSLGSRFAGAQAVALSRVLRSGESMIGADLDYGMRGGYHQHRTNMVMADGHVLTRSDQSRILPYSAVTSWADPGPTAWGEYGNQKPGFAAVKGWGY
jgi:prepilin-type N-terminal cleavage/methylation domain-containing protein/prepilin-type processing-associated H-X9-DG protein